MAARERAQQPVAEDPCHCCSLVGQQTARFDKLARLHAFLSETAGAILQSSAVPQLLQAACAIAVEHGGFRGALVLRPDASGRLAIAAIAGDADYVDGARALPPADPADPRDSAGRPCVQTFLDGKLRSFADLRQVAVTDELKDAALRHAVGVHAVLALGQPAWGVLMLSAEHRVFDDEETAVLERVAAGIAYGHCLLTRTERLHALAYIDPVTALPNRHALECTATAGLAPGSVLGSLQIAGLRTMVGSRGRAFHDALLAALARRLQQQLQPGVFLAHAGAGNFLFRQLPQQDDALAGIRQALLRCTAEPLLVDGEVVRFALQCGLAVQGDDAGGLEQLERHAAAALAEAERLEQDCVVFDEQLRARAERRLRLERDLRCPDVWAQLTLHVQPKIDCRSGALLGGEALLRWNHPALGPVPPGEFIPLLEATGLIVMAGQWLASSALRIIADWHRRGHRDLRLAINVSVRELREPGYVEALRMLIGRAGVSGLDIEVTESTLMTDVQRMVDVFDRLHALGCGIAIDDFGTGFSSLSYLSRLPADVLKIDRSFVAQMVDSPDALSLVTNIISLAHTLGMKVVAEGVETEEQRRLLALLRCDVLQGYLLGRPVPVEEFARIHLQAAASSTTRSAHPVPSAH